MDMNAPATSAMHREDKVLGMPPMEGDISGDPLEGDRGVDVYVGPPASGGGYPPPATLGSRGSLPSALVGLPSVDDLSTDMGAEMDEDLLVDGNISMHVIAVAGVLCMAFVSAVIRSAKRPPRARKANACSIQLRTLPVRVCFVLVFS